MDKYDEAKHVRKPDDVSERELERDEATTEAPGSVLGLGRSKVPKSPDDPSASREARMRHDGTRGFEDERSARGNAMPQTPGATGIDMGAGGTGTQIDEED